MDSYNMSSYKLQRLYTTYNDLLRFQVIKNPLMFFDRHQQLYIFQTANGGRIKKQNCVSLTSFMYSVSLLKVSKWGEEDIILHLRTHESIHFYLQNNKGDDMLICESSYWRTSVEWIFQASQVQLAKMLTYLTTK